MKSLSLMVQLPVIKLLDDLPINKGYKEIISIQALLKGKKEDEIIKKLTALGIKEIYFVETERSNIKAKEISANRVERWKKIAMEECKQSERDICRRD
jgi:RsmE family RNA methyltransferase